MNSSKATALEMTSAARAMRARGADIEDILEELRKKCPSIIRSISFIREIMNVPLDEAKRMVHYSRTWSDMRDPISDFHDSAETIADEHGAIDAPGERRP